MTMLSIIVPAYDEEKYMEKCLADTCAFFKGRDFEVIVVNDGSHDKTAEIVRNYAAAHPDCKVTLLSNEHNTGKGYSVRKGVLAARGDVVLYMDADLSTPLEEFDKLAGYLKEYDLVIASREAEGALKIVRQPPQREFMGRVFNLIVRLFLFGGYKDTQCGFKVFKRQFAQVLFGEQAVRTFAFDLEVIARARKGGLKIKEVGVRWINRNASRVRLLRDPLDMLFSIFKIRAKLA